MSWILVCLILWITNNCPVVLGISSSSSSTGSYSLAPIDSVYYYNSHSYVLYPISSDWLTINATSFRLGGYITTINDVNENLFVYDTFIVNLLLPRGISNTNWLGVWLGYVRTCSSCSSFYWSNGETSNYTNWAGGEPNNSGGVEFFTVMLPGGVWNDEPEAGILALNWAVIEFNSIIVNNPFNPLAPVPSPSSSQTCVSLLTPNITVGSSAVIYLTDPCQFFNSTLLALRSYAIAPVCRFYPSMFQSPGYLLLNTTYGNTTDVSQSVIACPVSSLLPAGIYVIQLSLYGGTTFKLPVINSLGIMASTLVVGSPNSLSSNATSALNISTVSLQHLYDLNMDVFSPGYNLGDVQLITWQTPIGASPYLTLLLEVTFEFWSSTSLVSRPSISSEPCYVIANSLFSNQSSHVWTVPNITEAVKSLGIDSSYVRGFRVRGHYASVNVSASSSNQGIPGGRRLLQLQLVPILVGIGIGLVSNWLYDELKDLKKYCTAQPSNCVPDPSPYPSTPECAMDSSCGLCGPGGCGGPPPSPSPSPSPSPAPSPPLPCIAYDNEDCPPPPGGGGGSGTIWGDVHLITMDGLYYDFQAIGAFWLLLSNPAIYTHYNISGFAMQVQLQPLSYTISPGSPAALSYNSVTYMAEIGFQADSTCGIITLTPRAALSPRSQTYFDIVDAGINVEIPYIPPLGSTFASSIAYQLSCATVYLTAPNTAVINTYNGYTLTLTTCAGYGRLCSLTTNLPSYAFNSTAGLAGSWDGNRANDFVDFSGHDWFKTYLGNLNAQGAYAGSYGTNDAAGYAFGMTWTVRPNQSFFVSSSPPQIGCLITEDDTTLFSVGCLFKNPSNASNLLTYNVNVTAVLQSFNSSNLPVLPAIWPNTTLQAQAITACEAATGIYNTSNALVQNCLLDVYVLNSTSGAMATGQVVTQLAIQLVELPILNVTSVNQSVALILVNASSSLSKNGGHCTSISVSLSGLTAVRGNQTQCVYVAQIGSGTYYSSVDVPSNLQSSNTDATIISLRIGNLTAGAGYTVRLAFVVITSTSNSSMQTGWTTATFTTLANVTTPGPVITPSSLCLIFYALPGNVDYPWSSAISLSFVYDHTLLNTASGQAVGLISGTGTRTYTNRFGVSATTPLILSQQGGSTTSNLLYLGSSVPVDSSGLTLTMNSPIQLPGAGHGVLHSTLRVYNMSGVVVEDGSSTIDGYGQAFLSSLPGFVNVTIQNFTIGASNVNSLAADYTHCAAPITFTNGLRPPTQPSISNGAAQFSYSYHISDGLTYTVQTNLSIQTQSAFATHQDGLGNPYQVILNVTGSRVYTYLPTGAVVSSTINSIMSSNNSARFYPYSLLAAAPGVYPINTAPFLDADGLTFLLTPSVPDLGVAPHVGAQHANVSIMLYSPNPQATAVLTESYTQLPNIVLQRQYYSFNV